MENFTAGTRLAASLTGFKEDAIRQHIWRGLAAGTGYRREGAPMRRSSFRPIHLCLFRLAKLLFDSGLLFDRVNKIVSCEAVIRSLASSLFEGKPHPECYLVVQSPQASDVTHAVYFDHVSSDWLGGDQAYIVVNLSALRRSMDDEIRSLYAVPPMTRKPQEPLASSSR